MDDDNNPLSDFWARIEEPHHDLLKAAAKGQIDDEKHRQLAAIVREYQDKLRPYADGMPAEADIMTIEDGEAAASVEDLFIAFDALDDVAAKLGLRDAPESRHAAEPTTALFDSAVIAGEEAVASLSAETGDGGRPNDYTTLDADSYTVRTVIPYNNGSEVREYDIAAARLSAFITKIEDAAVERVVTVEAKIE